MLVFMFKSIIHLILIHVLCEVGIKVLFFPPCGYQVVPEAFVQKISLPLLKYFRCPCQKSIAHGSVSLFLGSRFCFFDLSRLIWQYNTLYDFIVSLEFRKYMFSSSALLFQDWLVILGPLFFHTDFRSILAIAICKKSLGEFWLRLHWNCNGGEFTC